MRHDQLKTRFLELATQWKKQTGHISRISKRIEHPAYQEIVAMGKSAIHHILLDMIENGPEDWFWALTTITGENPITDDIAGHMQKMADVWIKWGVDHGYVKDTRK